MAKFATYFSVLCLLSLENLSEARDVFFPHHLSTNSEKLKTALTIFKTEVNFAIKVGQFVINEDEKLLESLHDSATTIQKKVSDDVNGTMTVFGKNMNNLFSEATMDVTKCMMMSSAIESTATDILINANTCVHDKLNEAQVYVEKSISYVKNILSRLDSLKNNVDTSYLKIMKHENVGKFLYTEMFLKTFYSEPSNASNKILSILADTTLVISRINGIMISDCVPTETILSFINNAHLVSSKIETCIADLNSPNADLQSLSATTLQVR